MNILQTLSFKKSIKKLHANQKKILDQSVKIIAVNPLVGELKKGDLASIRVYKFQMLNSLVLLAYIYDEKMQTVTLLKMGSHENFYRDIKQSS